jgi:phage tail sheath gpL-like
MSISFNEIPSNVRVPFTFVEFDNSGAATAPGSNPYNALMIGQRLAAGTIAARIPTTVSSADQGKRYFGVGSLLALMIDAWFKNNRKTKLTVIALDDASAGVMATKTLTITGPATAAGTLYLYIGGKLVSVAVTLNMTAAQLATAIVNAVTADTSLPYTAVAVSGVVTLTCKWKGETGNVIDVRLNYYSGDATPAGIAITIAAGTSGATNPDVTDAIAAFGPIQYQIVACPYVDSVNMALIKAELADRWGPTVQKEGFCFIAKDDTLGNLETFGGLTNSQFFSTLGLHSSPTPSFVIAAAYAAVIAFYGEIDPARPFQTLELKGVLAPNQADRFTVEEDNILLYDGISTAYVGPGGEVRIQRAITMYRKSALGADDDSYLDVTTVLTLAYLRYSLRTRIQNKYPRHKVANDGTRYGPGQAIVTPSVIKAECVALARQWETLGLVEGADAFTASLIVERNSSDPNRIDIQMAPDLVNQFIVAGVQIKFMLQGAEVDTTAATTATA